MRDLLEYLARALVDDPSAVAVEQFDDDDGTLVLELTVGEDDYGKVIGRGVWVGWPLSRWSLVRVPETFSQIPAPKK